MNRSENFMYIVQNIYALFILANILLVVLSIAIFSTPGFTSYKNKIIIVCTGITGSIVSVIISVFYCKFMKNKNKRLHTCSATVITTESIVTTCYNNEHDNRYPLHDVIAVPVYNYGHDDDAVIAIPV